MLGMFKKKTAPVPAGPFQFEVAVEVEKPAADVYPLIDWADRRNSKRELGHIVETLGSDPRRFRLIMTDMPDHRFDMTVIREERGYAYSFVTDIQPRVGRLDSDEENYVIEPLGADRCKLRLTCNVTFIGGMTMDELEGELMMMTMACQRALIKLKVHAEMGVEAVRSLEGEIG
ncbi:hypothetical protein H9L13_02730 [Sphingomonas lutea]|uniref:SRPBCC family protein n=1 Tax=Sphingomonas lutea TaxID=1045317 RepID=A0A7G9SJ35_9SPHN|nr:hypothetical protein [Sphingomonas lutea]QNN67860.1 hypothetical protein H9L13_02730 [Sphingomonas lutea]